MHLAKTGLGAHNWEIYWGRRDALPRDRRWLRPFACGPGRRYSRQSLRQRLYAAYRPIARESLNAAAGTAIDLFFGFAMMGCFLLLRPALPGSPLAQGIVFGLIAWFFRTLMGVAAQWLMFTVPPATLFYELCVGLLEMVLIGALYGVALPVREAQR